MALIQCPDCGRNVSDRAKTCPDCAAPVAELVAEAKAAAARAESVPTRKRVEGKEVDCPRCDARGFFEVGKMIRWCVVCEYTGRLPLFEASDGYYGVAPYAIDRFLAGELHADTSGVVFHVGKSPPSGHRFPQPADRNPIDPTDPAIPWTLEEPGTESQS